jgi:hypothetical protein
MTIANTTGEGRARLDFELGDDEPSISPEITDEKIREISEKAGFNAGGPRRSSVKSEIAKPEVLPERRRGRRTKTGRTLSFNTKIRPETYEKIRSLSDKATEREGRPVSFAEIIERGIEKLE